MGHISRRAILGALAAASSKRPNFLVIAGKMPNAERIASEGLRFSNAFVTTPLEIPSTTSIFTGRYVHAHRVATNGNPGFVPRMKTFQQMLHDAGYLTAGIRESPRAEPFSIFSGDNDGQILDILQQGGQLDRTVVIFTSTSGSPSRSSRDESIRVPLYIRYPKLIKPGRSSDAFALNVDIAPSIFELAGIRLPNNLHGRSLVPLIKGKVKELRQSFLIEYFADPAFPASPTWVGVRTARWKYTRYVDLEGKDELYDLQTDPKEQKNRIDEPEGRETLRVLRPELQTFLRTTV